jgi:hypothetical protein
MLEWMVPGHWVKQYNKILMVLYLHGETSLGERVDSLLASVHTIVEDGGNN